MTKFLFWQRWLFVAGLIITIFGVVFAIFNGTILFKWFDNFYNHVFWGSGDIPDIQAESFKIWIYGVLGAVMAGWGVFLSFIAHYPFRNCERWSWNCIVTGLLLWYVIDTTASLYFKVYFNVIFNTVILISVALPVIITRKRFYPGKSEM